MQTLNGSSDTRPNLIDLIKTVIIISQDGTLALYIYIM